MKMFDLSGKVAIVTGGNSGIGFGIAEGLAEAGATLVIVGRRAEANAAAVKAFEARNTRAFAIEADVGKEDDCKRLVEQAAERAGRLDILVNNAGTALRKPPQDYTGSEWRHILDVNLSSAFYCAHAAYPHMCRAGGGKIISIGSMMSIFGMAFAVAYGASKGGIVQMTKGLATAWGKDNIQSNALLPGWIDTPFTQAGRQQVPGLHERVLARTPAGRWGEPKDFAGAAVFLASAASNFVNGASIVVDGGYSSMG
jgi:2-dehydro-3-deoxy-D-gluconate 5-dehydrogenase